MNERRADFISPRAGPPAREPRDFLKMIASREESFTFAGIGGSRPHGFASDGKGPAPQNSMRAPSSTTRFGGMLKKSVAALAFRDMRLNSRFRHRIIGAGPVDKSSARPR